MVSYLEAGERTLIFYRNPGHPKLNRSRKAEVAAHWHRARAISPSLFNSPLWAGNTIVERGREILIGINRVDYRTYKWARDHHICLPGAYAAGNCLFLFDPQQDGYILLERSANVAFDGGKISGVGGVVDYAPVSMAKFPQHVETTVRTEAAEELWLENGLQAVAFLGWYWDSITLKVEFAYSAIAQVLGVKDPESTGAICVPREQLLTWLESNSHRLEESTRHHLEHLAGRLSSSC